MKKLIALFLCLALLLPFAQPATATSLSAERTEVLSMRDAYSNTYLLSDGSYQYVGRAEPIHYKDSSGSYVPINNAITSTVKLAGYKYTNTANKWNAHFSEQLNSSNAVMLTSGKYSVAFSFTEQTGTAEVVRATDISNAKDTSVYHQKLSADNRAVIYRDVAENVDIAYTVLTGALKEDIILKSKAAPSVYKFRLTANGLTLKETSDTVALFTAEGEEVFSFAPLYMEDANGKRSEKVSLTYTGVKNGYELTVSADTEFLNAADTAYPVVIDPTIGVSGSDVTLDTCVDQQYPSSNYYLSENLWTGGALGTNAMRTYIKFDFLQDIYACQVTSAYIKLRKKEYQTPHIVAHPVTQNWSSSSVTWNNKPAYNSSITSSAAVSDDAIWYKVDITNILKGWLDCTIDNYGVVLKEPNETSSSQKTKFYSSDAASNNPELIIKYNPYYGSRSYQYSNSTNVNCMGYALNYNANIDNSALGINTASMLGMTFEEIAEAYENSFIEWMDDNLNLDGSNWGYIESYNSRPQEGWFKVLYVINFNDIDDDNVFDSTVTEGIGYHWYYQTNTGDWAEKGSCYSTSVCHANSATTNPITFWQSGANEHTKYVYGYLEIRDS